MHPFLPVLSILFLASANFVMVFLRLNATHPEVAPQNGAIYNRVFMCLLIGAGLAFWLRRFGVLYPTWVAILSLLTVAALGLSRA
jgi:hypothetical protein